MNTENTNTQTPPWPSDLDDLAARGWSEALLDAVADDATEHGYPDIPVARGEDVWTGQTVTFERSDEVQCCTDDLIRITEQYVVDLPLAEWQRAYLRMTDVSGREA